MQIFGNNNINQNIYENLNTNVNIRYNRPINQDETVYYETQIPYNKSKFKDFLAFIITVFIIIVIGFILWKIPVTHNFLVDIYNDNPPIKAICDFFLHLFGKS